MSVLPLLAPGEKFGSGVPVSVVVALEGVDEVVADLAVEADHAGAVLVEAQALEDVD
jgi:hypothetical protein